MGDLFAETLVAKEKDTTMGYTNQDPKLTWWQCVLMLILALIIAMIVAAGAAMWLRILQKAFE